jgi:hypothetical protein
VPDNATVAGEFVALLTNETDPEARPLTPGMKLIVTFFDEPAAIVAGRFKPVELKTPPVKLAAVTVTDPVPELESVTARPDVIPKRTLPKDRVAGDALRSCVTVAATLTVADALFVVSATLFAVTA